MSSSIVAEVGQLLGTLDSVVSVDDTSIWLKKKDSEDMK